MKLAKNNQYIYTGPGEGKGEIHQLLEVNGERCVTWGRSRHSWLGTPVDFVQNFESLEEGVV